MWFVKPKATQEALKELQERVGSLKEIVRQSTFNSYWTRSHATRIKELEAQVANLTTTCNLLLGFLDKIVVIEPAVPATPVLKDIRS